MKKNLATINSPTIRQLRAGMLPSIRSIFDRGEQALKAAGLKRVDASKYESSGLELARMETMPETPEVGSVYFSAIMQMFGNAGRPTCVRAVGISVVAMVVHELDEDDGFPVCSFGEYVCEYIGNIDQVYSAWTSIAQMARQTAASDSAIMEPWIELEDPES